MLRITLMQDESSTTLKLEGKLAGPWVRELEKVWRGSVTKGKRLVLDLSAVSALDQPGADLLALMREGGAEFVGEDLFIGYTLQKPRTRRRAGIGGLSDSF